MRIGIIDLGTNSVRFALFEVLPFDQSFHSLYREKIMLRPGQGVFTSGRLPASSMERMSKAFRHFASVARQHKVWHLEAYATSALREAENSDRLVNRILTETGIQIRVISGQKEAELIALGITHNEPQLRGESLLIDIGGGSTEISFCRGRSILSSLSLDLGAQRLSQLFLTREHLQPGPLRDLALKKMRHFIQQKLRPLKAKGRGKKPQLAIGSSGTLKALAKALSTEPLPKKKKSKKKKKSGGRALPLKPLSQRPHFSRSQLSTLIGELVEMPQSQYTLAFAIDPKRKDLILPGAVLLEEVLFSLDVEKVTTTDFSLREGLLIKKINSLI